MYKKLSASGGFTAPWPPPGPLDPARDPRLARAPRARHGPLFLWQILDPPLRDLTLSIICNYSVSQKNPPWGFWHFVPNGWEYFHQILHTFISMLKYKFLFNYLQLWRSYAILRMTTQFTSYAQTVHHWPKRMLAFSAIFPKQLGIFTPNFTRLLPVPIYARMQIFIQLSLTMTKLCHIKCDHPACVSADGWHFEHMMVVALNMV